MDTQAELRYADAFRAFTPAEPDEQRVGLELECGLVDPDTGRCVDYFGRRGARSLIEAAVRDFEGAPIVEAGSLVGARLSGGAQFTLELGGALEYASQPYRSVAELVAVTRRDMLAVAEVAARMNIAVLPAGMLPFTPASQIAWIPKPRVQIMRRYFRKLGPAASAAEAVMGLTLSAQTSLDYSSEGDFLEKLRLLVKAAPVAAALFVNSPIEDGEPTGVLSRRMQMWGHVDPSRCGVLKFAAEPDVSVRHLVDWALGLPMIYRATGGGHRSAPDRTFAELLRNGFEDGAKPGMSDWESHLSQVWPHVRARRTLETRASDGLSWRAFPAAPAFWVGLTYDDHSRRAALALLDGLSATELEEITSAVAVSGLAASVGRQSVGGLAHELLDLARGGLRARVDAGAEPASVVEMLDPLYDVVRSGITCAERFLADWTGPMRCRPAALVDAYRI